MRCKSTILPLAGVALAGVVRIAAAQQASERPFGGFIPGRCIIASQQIDRVQRREVVDTAKWTPKQDTLYRVTTDSVQMCQTAAATKADGEALNTAHVHLLTHEDSIALATARRHLTGFAKRTAAERAWELYLAFSDNMEGKPARVEEARAAIAALDKLGKPAASVRVLAHFEMASFAHGREQDATTRAETDAAVAAWKELPEETRLWRATTLAYTYELRAQLEALTKGGDAARAVVDTALATLPLEARQARAIIEGAKVMYGNMGKKAQPLEAGFWYNTGAADQGGGGVLSQNQVSLVGTGSGSGGAPPVRPGRGKVSVLLDIYRPCTGGCYAMLASIRRLEDRLHSQNFEVTFLTQTWGFYLDTAPATPQAEAQYDSIYFVGDVKIPGALAIANTQFSFKADGRRINAPTANGTNYPQTGVVFVDKSGIIRFVASYWDRRLEDRYAKMLEGMLAEGGGAAP